MPKLMVVREMGDGWVGALVVGRGGCWDRPRQEEKREMRGWVALGCRTGLEMC